MKLKEAIAISHTLSTPSKMPWFGYSIPAYRCKIGSKLRKIKDSVCSKCYALKGRYTFPNVMQAMEKRADSLHHPGWVEAMVTQLNHYSKGELRHFRWHDSGDLQDSRHLQKISDVCLATPHIQHYLPTREGKIVESLADRIPPNLHIKISAMTIGEANAFRIPGVPIATVGAPSPERYECDARDRGGECGPCRKCWTEASINYPLH